MVVNIIISNKAAYTIIALAIVLLVGTIVIASDPNVLGHSLDELDLGVLSVEGDWVRIKADTPYLRFDDNDGGNDWRIGHYGEERRLQIMEETDSGWEPQFKIYEGGNVEIDGNLTVNGNLPGLVLGGANIYSQSSNYGTVYYCLDWGVASCLSYSFSSRYNIDITCSKGALQGAWDENYGYYRGGTYLCVTN